MRFILFAGAVATFFAASTTALADDGPTGLELGLRLGYSLPFGNASGSGPTQTTTMGNTTTTTSSTGAKLSDAVSGQIPIWVDAGYRILPSLYVGAFFQYGIAFIPSNSTTGCGASGVSCSGHDLMFGIDAHYHFLPGGQIDPWVGVGIGYESFGLSQSANGQSSTGSFSGFQFVNLQAGADYKVMSNFGIGPFVALSLGEYTNASTTFGGMTYSGSIQNTAMHEWLTLGVRGAYDLGF
jgi:hypothetical protein